MIRRNSLLLALSLLLCAFSLSANAQSNAQTNVERVAEIQTALREVKLDGWLFYDFRGSDPLAYRILKLGPSGITTRRWFYYIPATGEPIKIVHAIERGKLDQLPGKRVVYLPWQQLQASLREALTGRSKPRSVEIHIGTGKRIAMQYSPENAIPYMSRVDAGTIELIRSFGVEPVTSADLVQRFEAVWSDEQRQMHNEAADAIHRIIMESFKEVARRIRADIPTTEYDIQQFMEKLFAAEGMTNDDDPPIIAVNGNAANPHYQPTREINSPIKRGDFVLFDVWYKSKKPDGVYADETWTGYVGESVPEEYTRIFNIVRDARDAAVKYIQDNLRAGKSFTGASVDDVSRGVITHAGYGPQFSHDGQHIVFHSLRDGDNSVIYTMNTDGSAIPERGSTGSA